MITIKSNLGHIMVDKNIHNITELKKTTGLSRDSLNKLRYSKNLETIKLETIIKLCNSLEIDVQDLLSFSNIK